jgi:predicted transcriptional regulator
VPRARKIQFLPEQGYREATGELENYLRPVTVREKRAVDTREREPHVRQYDATMMELARLPLTGSDRTVLTALVAMMSFDGPFLYSTNEIADSLGMVPQNVSRSLRNLKEQGVVLEMGGRRIMVHPKYFWKGDAKERLAWLAQIDRGEFDLDG